MRQQRGSLVGWAVGLVLTGATFGSLTDSVLEAVRDNPVMSDVIASGGGGELVDQFFAVLMVYIALGAAGFAVSSVLRLHSEEAPDGSRSSWRGPCRVPPPRARAGGRRGRCRRAAPPVGGSRWV